jgi:hypothetical protein
MTAADGLLSFQRAAARAEGVPPQFSNRDEKASKSAIGKAYVINKRSIVNGIGLP